MRIAVYLAAVPTKTKNQQKRELLERFARGAKVAGDEVWLIDANEVVDADIAVLQGWIGMKQAPHLDLRKRVIDRQVTRLAHTLVIDSNLLGFLNPGDKDQYLRYSLDGIFPTTGYYFDRNPDPNRWESIKQNYNFQERPWNTHGQNILVCLQRNGGWSMSGLGVMQWLEEIIPEIQRHTMRKIIIRPHPGSMAIVPDVQRRWPDIEISTMPDIRQDFDRAWATVTYNSSPGVASLLWGVPAWVTDPDFHRSQAYPWAETYLSSLNNPRQPDRREFYQRLAQCHFNSAEVASGEAWQFMRARLPQ